jgi:type III pantothenate kinase
VARAPDTLLALDAGNTRVKWGVHDGTAWRATGAVEIAATAMLAAAWSGAPAPMRAIACNVAGPEVRRALEEACARSGIALEVIASPASQLGVTNGYREPAQLGPDRWAALVAAHALVGGHKLVVNAGTALTVDALTAEGRFLGGLIVPGPAMMRRALGEGTAGLRLTDGRFAPFPQSTPDAITSGAIQAAVGAVLRMATALATQGSEVERIVLSGGAAREIEPHLPIPAAIHENLVLDGLRLIARNG